MHTLLSHRLVGLLALLIGAALVNTNLLAQDDAPTSSDGVVEAVDNSPLTEGQLSEVGFEGTGEENAAESDPDEEFTPWAVVKTLPPIEDIVFERPESVCGTDNRVQISPTTSYPWRAICFLVITLPNGQQGTCTGWLIGRGTIMTAGHCVHTGGPGGVWAKKIEIYPGRNGGSSPYGRYVGRRFRSVRGWTSKSKATHDYGCILLPRSKKPGNIVGWFGFETRTNSQLIGKVRNLSGYPGDKPSGTQWFMSGNVTSATSRRFFYLIDTFGGQSGSPVWRFDGTNRWGNGIHAYGGCPNGATRINSKVFNNMLKWKNLRQ